MRILFFNYEFPPLGGGGANANAYLFKELSKIPTLRIDCVTSAWGPDDQTFAFSDNITLHRLAVGKKELHYWTQREVVTYLRRAHGKATELLQHNHYDGCHAFFGFPSGMLGWLRRHQIPYLVSLRGSDVPGFNPRFSLQYLALKPLFRQIWRQASFVVANSVGLRSLAHEFEPSIPIQVIPNGIDTAEFYPSPEIPCEQGHILCVSRLVARKGVQHLLEAMPCLLRRTPWARLTLVGEGDLALELQKRSVELGLANRVRFRGYVPHEELPSLYRMAQVLVQPSFFEGMSNSVLEAMACGLPIVATGEGGREELFRGNALTAPYGESEALANVLADLLENPETMAQMGRQSALIANELSWQAVAEGYFDLYRHMCSIPTGEVD